MKKKNVIIPVILAGGNGSRLWPLSRELYPKQFLTLIEDLTMLQSTINRLNGLNCSDPIIICNEEHRFIVAEQLRQINRLAGNIILEPVGKNTAPAITLAALDVLRNSSTEEPLLLVLAADHVIQDKNTFLDAIKNAMQYAKNDKLVTFGILPSHPETGYGYIKRGEDISDFSTLDAFSVDEFKEKPHAKEANEYLLSGEYYWNSGMFLFKASRFISELRCFRDDILTACEQSIELAVLDLDFLRVNKNAFSNCPAESIDYAVMENTKDAVVIPMNAGWSDVGSWSSLWDVSQKNSDNNVIQGDVFTHHTSDCYIYSESALTAAIGTKDLIIVQTKDAVLVADRHAVQDVKKIVEKIKSEKRTEHRVHREEYRPWGVCDSIDDSEHYQVKKIIVKSGEGISLQIHHHRAEHWIVVAGTARVTIDKQVKLLRENESIYIPVGIEHCLENPGNIPLEIIEVRSGSYLGEDDIIRISDRYGRK